MITVISPAKRMNFSDSEDTEKYTQPEFVSQSTLIMERLKRLSARQIKNLMSINDNLAETNYDRFQNWQPDFREEVAKQAILAFKGDVFLGIDAGSFEEEDFDFAQNYLRILSGLHGILRPLDLIRPYRLEMGTSMKIGRPNNLQEFWKPVITPILEQTEGYQKDNTIINLASIEYFSALNLQNINARVIVPTFKEFRNGTYKPIHIFLKKARGYMVRYIIKNKIIDPEDLKLFDIEGYSYNDQLSNTNQWTFTRG